MRKRRKWVKPEIRRVKIEEQEATVKLGYCEKYSEKDCGVQYGIS